MDKEVINANEYTFTIKDIKAGGKGLFINHPRYSCERLLVVCHTVRECKDFIQKNFIGKKGTKFNIEVY